MFPHDKHAVGDADVGLSAMPIYLPDGLVKLVELPLVMRHEDVAEDAGSISALSQIADGVPIARVWACWYSK